METSSNSNMVTAIIILLLSGLIDGILEGWSFDGRKSFERKYKVKPLSFFGSLSHMRAQIDPNLYNKLWGVFDFYHMADKARKGGYLLSGFLILENSTFEIHTLLLFIGAYTVSAATKIIGMEWIRN